MAISDKITSIQNHLKDDWDSVESLIGDTELDKNIENISSALDDLYNDLPKVTGSGTSITLDDTRKGRLESTLSGNTSQTTYSGKNLLHQDQYITTRTTNGITYTNNGDGTFNVTGTATTNTNIQILTGASQIGLESGKTYYFYSSKPYNGTDFNMSIPFAQDGAQKYLTANNTITTSGTLTNIKLSFYVGSGVPVNAQNVKLMLVEGSTPGDYEPFVGETASPNPDYPQDIHVVSGDNKINVYGRNLLENQYLPIPSADNTATYEVKNAYLSQGTYTLATTDNSTFGNTVYIKLFKKDKQVVKESGHLSTSNGNYSTATYNYFIGTANNLTYIQFTIDDDYYARIGLLNSDNTKEVMLVKGTEIVRTYEPYSSNSYPINLGVKNLWGGFSNSFTRTDLGVQFIANTDGTITANGTATNVATSILLAEATANGIYKSLPKGTYTVSGGGANYTIEVYDKDNVVRLAGIAPNSSSASFTISNTTNVVLRVQVASGETINKTIKLQLETGDKANSYTPYGTTPIELAEISTYNDEIFRTNGKNLCNGINQGVYLNNDVNRCGVTSGDSGLYIPVNGGQYTISTLVKQTRYRVACSNDLPPSVGSAIAYNGQNKDNTSNSITINTTGYNYLIVNATDLSAIQIEKGSTATEYNPYGTGEWYYKEATKKVVLDGTETISAFDATSLSGSYQATFGITARATTTDKVAISDKFIGALLSDRTTKTNIVYSYSDGYLRIATNVANTMAGFKTWLGTNNPKVLLEAATPTYNKITYEPLLEQLEAYYHAKSKATQTNISQENNDLPFEIDASALEG